MSKLATSVLLGIVFLSLGFALCLIFVIGVKALIVTTQHYIATKSRKPDKTIVTRNAPKKKRSNYKPVRSIEINPEEIDRIYVKKSS